MSTLLGHSRPQADTAQTSQASLDSLAEADWLERSLARRWGSTRWIGWRLRFLVGTALAGCLALFLIARTLAGLPEIEAHWRVNALGQVELAASTDAALRPREGDVLTAMQAGGGEAIDIRALALHRSARWIVNDERREQFAAVHDLIAQALTQRVVRLHFPDGAIVEVSPRRTGFGGLGAMFWLLAVLALGLYLVAMVVVLSRPTAPNVAYALMAVCQAANLGFIAVESAFEFGLPGSFARSSSLIRMALDLITAAAIVHAACVHPRRLAHGRVIAAAAWILVASLVALAASGQLTDAWWWTQGVGTLLGLAAIALLSWSYRVEPHPFAIVMRRFGVVTASTWILLTLAIAGAGTRSELQQQIAAIGPVIWVVFLASLLLVIPFLSRSQQVLREFSMLAGVSTAATSLDLVFVAVFSLGQFASLTLSLFLALGAYAGARQWMLNRMIGSGVLTAERMFEQLYHIAREVEARPERLPTLLMRLLRDLFEPLEIAPLDRSVHASRAIADGSTLVVPVPDLLDEPEERMPRSIALRFARRGRRLFTNDDARLTDRVVEQLKRAIAHDRAVEQGRSEERARLAQDLHDDIGARLLTLMYKAPSPEMEDYVRHTLLDLKTLTRGLAAASHPLSHSVAEWKADITQRLAAVQCEVGWHVSIDRDIVLSVVQWSALTRVLRELVTNAIAHAQATRADISISLEHERLDLTVSDNGIGRNPQSWSHGLGLGGVRKRVKQLGGDVEWRENLERGITCHVRIRELSRRA